MTLEEREREKWMLAANLHLLKHVRKALAHRFTCYGRPASYLAMKNRKREDFPNADASTEFLANISELVSAKNTWAAEMYDIARNTGGTVPSEVQRSIWDDLLARAEARVS